MDDEIAYLWEERAAILEYEAGMSRSDAEDETDREFRNKYSIPRPKTGERRTTLRRRGD